MPDTRMLPGCRVVDFTDKKGWSASHLLAGLGSDVIRLDPPGRPLPDDILHCGKHSVSLDIEKPQGSRLFRKLISVCDVLIESSPPGYLRSLGLDYSTLKETNPALVMASISTFGRNRAASLRNSSDLTASAAGGQLFLNGEPGRPPLPLCGDQAFLTAGLFAANGILLALRARKLNGRGQYIDISIQECLAATLDHTLVRYFSSGQIAQRTGRLYWNKTFGLLRCRDGWVGISFMQSWDTLVEWMDSEGMAGDLKDSRWQNPGEREKEISHISDVIEKWTLTHSARELVETGQLMRLPWAESAGPEAVLNSPQLKERGYWIEAADPVTGVHVRFPGAPVKMGSSPWRVDSHCPRAGEHNLDIYRGWLGLSDSEIENLRSEKVI